MPSSASFRSFSTSFTPASRLPAFSCFQSQ